MDIQVVGGMGRQKKRDKEIGKKVCKHFWSASYPSFLGVCKGKQSRIGQDACAVQTERARRHAGWETFNSVQMPDLARKHQWFRTSHNTVMRRQRKNKKGIKHTLRIAMSGGPLFGSPERFKDRP